MILKIISDGTAKGTRVVDAASGESVDGVVAITWVINARDGLAACSLTLFNTPIEVVADPTVESADHA